MTAERSSQSQSQPAPPRRRGVRLDPYTVDATITLEDWRRTVGKSPAVHIVHRHDDPLAAA